MATTELISNPVVAEMAEQISWSTSNKFANKIINCTALQNHLNHLPRAANRRRVAAFGARIVTQNPEQSVQSHIYCRGVEQFPQPLSRNCRWVALKFMASTCHTATTLRTNGMGVGGGDEF